MAKHFSHKNSHYQRNPHVIATTNIFGSYVSCETCFNLLLPRYDYLEFVGGIGSRHRLCGEVTSGYEVISDEEEMNVTFHSDDSIKFTGFWFSYQGN